MPKLDLLDTEDGCASPQAQTGFGTRCVLGSVILKDGQFKSVKWINLIHKRNLIISNAGLNA